MKTDRAGIGRFRGRLPIAGCKHRGLVMLFLHAVGAVVAGAALDGLHDSNRIRTVICRQEGGAAMMADVEEEEDEDEDLGPYRPHTEGPHRKALRRTAHATTATRRTVTAGDSQRGQHSRAADGRPQAEELRASRRSGPTGRRRREGTGGRRDRRGAEGR